MNSRIWLPALGALLACACTKQPSVPNGTLIVDEDVALTRQADRPVDTATRELTATDDAILVAIVDENLTNVKLRLSTTDTGGDAPAPVEVENNLSGSGLELAALEVSEGARIRVTLTGPQDSVQPGKVHIRIRQYAPGAMRDPKFSQQLGAFKAWTAATNASFRADKARETGLADIQHAIDGLESTHGDATLAAEARLIKARMLYFFRVDWREARAEAQRAAAAFAHLPTPDALNEARAKYIEALALGEISNDRESKDPTPEEALRLSTEMIQSLSADTSALGPIDRARAMGSLARLDVKAMNAEGANKHFGLAREMFQAAGYTAGVREMRWSLGLVFVELGMFADAAREFDVLLPDIDTISDPELHVRAYLAVGRAQTFSDRTDEGAQMLLKALPLAQQYQLRQLEVMALMGLGYHYQNRGDMLQMGVFFDEALKIAREQKDVKEYVEALTAAATAARDTGNLDRAFELDKEAVRKSPTSVLECRTKMSLGLDYYRAQDLPSAIEWYRKSLAVDLNDPMSHIYTDGKLGLALFLIEHAPSTAKELAEADKLLAEAQETSTKVRDQWRVIIALRIRAALEARRGQNDAALAHLDQVFTLSQEYRQRSKSTEARSGMLRAEEHGFRGYLDIIFADVAKRGPGVIRAATPRELAGLRRLERARYDSFGGLRVSAPDAKTSARVDQIFSEMGQKSLKIAGLLKSNLDAAQKAELQGLQSDMARLHAELDNVRTVAADKQASGASPPDARRNFRALAAGAAQLSYALGANHVYAVVRSETGTVVTVLAPSRKDLEAQLGDFSKFEVQTASREIEAALEEISSVLLPAGLLPEKSSTVEIVAEGRIGNVPFPALRSPTNAQRRLAETHVVSMIMSLFDQDDTLRAQHARPYRFVALASGTGTYRAAVVDPTPRLQAATKEIRVAADLFTARDSTAKIKLFTGDDGTATALRD
ncbi:MAG TPA: tetratricopeptide repeat protein, partial [Steroidobacteraceae bacterium]